MLHRLFFLFILQRNCKLFCNYLIVNILFISIFFLAVFLLFFGFFALRFDERFDCAKVPPIGEKCPIPGKKPQGRYFVIIHEIFKPCDLEYITFRLFFQRIHVPAVYSVSACESLLPTDDFICFQNLQRLEEAFYYHLALF